MTQVQPYEMNSFDGGRKMCIDVCSICSDLSMERPIRAGIHSQAEKIQRGSPLIPKRG
jgi:hypothetical protein